MLVQSKTADTQGAPTADQVVEVPIIRLDAIWLHTVALHMGHAPVWLAGQNLVSI